EAAWARANRADVSELAPMAKLFVCSAFRNVTAMCQKIWGGGGFTLEYTSSCTSGGRSSVLQEGEAAANLVVGRSPPEAIDCSADPGLRARMHAPGPVQSSAIRPRVVAMLCARRTADPMGTGS